MRLFAERSTSLLVMVLVLAAAQAAASEWPQFRGPDGEGHAKATNLPTRWSDTENVAWKQEIPGKGWSSPVVWNGTVYLTTAVPQDGEDESAPQSLRALALDSRSGKILWNTEVFQQTTGTRVHKKNSHASPTPIVDGRRLFVHFGTHGTACLDLAGKVLWRNDDLKYAPVHGNGGSPILVGERLIFSCDGADVQFVTALDADTGKIIWRTARKVEEAPKKFSFSTPLAIEVDGRTQVISPGSGAVISYDAEDGTEIWRVRYRGYSVIPRPVYGHGMIFISTGYDSPTLMAIRVNGRGDVTDTHVAWTLSKAVPHSPSLLLIGSELYFVSDRGIASCLDARTGETHWQERIGGNFSASPLFADGRIYLQSEEGEGIVLNVGTKYEEIARNPLNERTLASYAVLNGAFLIRGDKHLFRLQGD